MKRISSLVLIVLLLCTLVFPGFAAQISDGNDVYANMIVTHDGEYRTDVVDGTAVIYTPKGPIGVTDAPSEAAQLVIIPMEGDALAWISGCLQDPVGAAYAIHFLDENENRIPADNVRVTLTAYGKDTVIQAVSDAGSPEVLDSFVSAGKVGFRTDGSPYYAVTLPRIENITVPVRGEDNTVHADITLKGDTVDLHELPFEEIDHVVGDHVNTGIVEIDLTDLDETVVRILLPIPTVQHIVEAAQELHNDTEALQIDFPVGSVKLDDKTLRVMVEQAECNRVMLVLEEVGKTRLNQDQEKAIQGMEVYEGYEAYMVCVTANKRISDFEGGVATLRVPFQIPFGKVAEQFCVWYVSDDGQLERLETRYEEGYLVWNVGHFSDFVIVYEDGSSDSADGIDIPVIPDVPGGSGIPGIVILLWLLFLLLLMILLVILLLRQLTKRKKENE